MQPLIPGTSREAHRSRLSRFLPRPKVASFLLIAGSAAAGFAQLPNAPGALNTDVSLPSVHAKRASGPITLDGKLNEPAWKDAEVMLLTQQSPYPGKPMPYLTEVRVLISGDALVFGFTCHDPKPSAIQAHTLERDGNQAGDDTITVLLDSFGDKRTAYYFQINSLAARFDGLVAGPRDFSTNWDGIWNARAARMDDGWSAEIMIPAQTLNFTSGHWGLQLDRWIPRDQTELRWASPTLDADLYDMRRAGDLEIMSPMHQGHGFELAPYTDGKMLRNFDPTNRNWLATGGGEVTWRITPQLAAIATVNTDFAETEVDARQINITPFPLYFPEKRAFFLEGANQYAFGLDLNQTYTFLPFFSRNVGLLAGYDIPLQGGLKINGHIGPWSLALLDVETRKTFVPDIVVQSLGLPSAKVEGTNLLASRIAYDLGRHTRLGAVVTHGDPQARLENLLVGTDAAWNTSTFLGKRNLQLGAWAATTQGQVPNGNREAWGLRVDYPNDLINCSAGVNRFENGFYPLLGFLPRPQTHQTDATCVYSPRPSPDGPFRAFRQFAHGVLFNRYADTNGNLQSQQVLVSPLRVTTKAGDSLVIQATLRQEILSTPFSIVPTVAYPVGSYEFQRYGFQLDTSQQRPFQFTHQSSFGGYYNGHMYHQMDSLNWTPFHGRLEAGATADDYFGHTPQGNFVERLYQFNGALSWSPDLSLSSFVQFDNISNTLSSNTRLRWTFRPGDDFFVIWDRAWTRDVSRPGVNLGSSAESITAKIRWTFRL